MPLPTLEIRRATRADLEALARLHEQFRKSLQRATPTRVQFTAALDRLLTTGTAHILVATTGSEAVGYTTLHVLHTAWTDTSVAVLEDLFVAELCRGRGVGHALVEAAIREATALGCSSLSLDTNERNEASQKVYRRLGLTCERARWSGGRQIRYDLRLAQASAAT